MTLSVSGCCSRRRRDVMRLYIIINSSCSVTASCRRPVSDAAVTDCQLQLRARLSDITINDVHWSFAS